MLQLPLVELGEWKPLQEASWETLPFNFVSDIDLVTICNDYINRHVNLFDMPVRLVDSYRSYLIQALKDVDYLIGRIKAGPFEIADQLNYVIDISLSRAQPWRFTGYLLSAIYQRLDSQKVISLDKVQLWHYIQPLIEESFEQGALFKIEKYIKVGHVMMDMSFDIGWDSMFSKASQLKALEGLVANPERAATLRELGLYVARNFWTRELYEAAKQVLYIGFPDIPQVIGGLGNEEFEELLNGMNSKQAVQLLFSEEMAKSSRNVSCNQIVEGAMRIIGGT